MKENQNNMQAYAMQYGTFMGIFWIIKFIFFPLGLYIPILEFIFVVGTIAVPFYGYYLTRSYRDKKLNGVISFGQAWIFATFMFMFAGLLVSVVHYIYFRFMDNGSILSYYQNFVTTLSKANIPGYPTKPMADQLTQAIAIVSSLTPIQLVMQLLSQNVIYGALMALPIALFVKKSKKTL
jgi:hypothetical protein